MVKYDLAWVLARKPLDHNDPNDAAEIQNFVSIAKQELESKVPGFVFDD